MLLLSHFFVAAYLYYFGPGASVTSGQGIKIPYAR